MRKLLALVVVVVVLGAAAPFGMGFVAQRQFTRIVDHWSQVPNAQVQLEDYHRGWFKSTARLAVTVKTPRRPTPYGALPVKVPPVKFELDETIFHGPLVFHQGVHFVTAFVEHHLKLAAEQQQAVEAFFKDQVSKPTLDGSTVISYSGASQNKLTVPAFTYTSQKSPAGQMKWQGLSISWKMTKNMENVNANIQFDGTQITSPDVKADIGPFGVNYQLHEAIDNLWVGHAKITLPKIKADGQKEKLSFSMDGGSLESKSDLKGGLLSVDATAKVGAFNINGVSYGPGEYVSNFKNLDGVALANLNKQANKLNQANLSPQEKQMMLFAMLPKIPKIFEKGAEFNIEKLFFKLPEGDINAKGSVKMLPMPSGRSASIVTMIRSVDAYFNLQLPKALVEKMLNRTLVTRLQAQQRMKAAMAKQLRQNAQNHPDPRAKEKLMQQAQFQPLTATEINEKANQLARQQITTWLQNGYLKEDGTRFVVHFAFKNGAPTINGKPVQGLGRRAMQRKPRRRPLTGVMPTPQKSQ
jgi:uncharacterized protein YdgA (DUF945 family)